MSVDWKAVGWFCGGVFVGERRPWWALAWFICGAIAVGYAKWKDVRAKREENEEMQP